MKQKSDTIIHFFSFLFKTPKGQQTGFRVVSQDMYF